MCAFDAYQYQAGNASWIQDTIMAWKTLSNSTRGKPCFLIWLSKYNRWLHICVLYSTCFSASISFCAQIPSNLAISTLIISAVSVTVKTENEIFFRKTDINRYRGFLDDKNSFPKCCHLTFSCAISFATSTISNVDSLFLAFITRAKINPNTDTVFFCQKPTETYQTLNCQHHNSTTLTFI